MKALREREETRRLSSIAGHPHPSHPTPSSLSHPPAHAERCIRVSTVRDLHEAPPLRHVPKHSQHLATVSSHSRSRPPTSPPTPTGVYAPPLSTVSTLGGRVRHAFVGVHNLSSLPPSLPRQALYSRLNNH